MPPLLGRMYALPLVYRHNTTKPRKIYRYLLAFSFLIRVYSFSSLLATQGPFARYGHFFSRRRLYIRTTTPSQYEISRLIYCIYFFCQYAFLASLSRLIRILLRCLYLCHFIFEFTSYISIERTVDWHFSCSFSLFTEFLLPPPSIKWAATAYYCEVLRQSFIILL